MEEEQTTQWPKIGTQKIKDRATLTQLITGELRYSGKVISSCSTSGTRRVDCSFSLNLFYLLNITNWGRTQVLPTDEVFS